MLTGTAGTVLIYLSIGSKNASLASLLEISYPAFVILFAYLLFRQVHVNAAAILGGLMTLLGAVLIIYSNR